MNKISKKLYSFYINRKLNSPFGIAEDFINDYEKHKFTKFKIHSIHKKGFTVDDWIACGLNKNNYKEYLSSADYASLHPLNGSFTKWIDDKLTLKYLCYGTDLNEYLPKYYFSIDDVGKIIPLVDYNSKLFECSVDDVICLLKKVKELAFKQVAGSLGIGFYKVEYKNDLFLINGKEASIDQLITSINALRNYIVIEYLKPHKDIAKFCSETPNTIRYLACKSNNEISMIKGFIRFGTIASNFVDNYNAGGVLCYLDKKGYFNKGLVLDKSNNKNVVIDKHPDSNEILNSKIPMWDKIINVVNLFFEHFKLLNYLGFDFVVTNDNKIKILEINSLTSLDCLQADYSVFDTEACDYFKELLVKRK